MGGDKIVLLDGAGANGTPSPGWGQLGRGNDVRVKYVSINSGLGGDRL